MDNQIISILENLEKRLDKMESSIITKDSLRILATKNDLQTFATKDDLKAVATKNDLKTFATKDDLKAVATKNDLERFATKDDLFTLKKELIDYTDGWCSDLLNAVDKSKADETEVKNLKVRVRNLERKVALD